MAIDGSTRLFVAIYPPLEAAAQMLRLLDGRASAPYRAVPLEQVHLTVQFIGDVSGRDRDATVESVARATAGLAAFRLEPRRMISLPRRGASRLIAVETSSPPPLAELHRRLIQRSVGEHRGRYGRPFLPHFTLARYPHESSPDRINEAIWLEPILVGEVRLMKSDLHSSGAKHTTEMSWTLSG